jgi:DNA ligase-1
MDERDMMHGDDWRGENVAGWLIAEKFNGCRAYWDGARLWTRNGNVVRIPNDWGSRLPVVHLDCEIWAGRAGFQVARLATQYGRFTPAVHLLAFDANVDGDFVERQEFVRRAVAGLDFIQAVEHRPYRSTDEALQVMRDVQSGGGEGVVARYPGNRYLPGRTREILKLKTPSNTEFARS